MGNAITHPSHYAEGRKYEPKDVIRDWGLNFNLGNAVKYISRAGRKEDAVEDLKKAQQYIQFEVEALEAEIRAEKSTPPSPTHPNCKCVVKPHKVGGREVYELEVPAGTPLEDIIQMAINKVSGGDL